MNQFFRERFQTAPGGDDLEKDSAQSRSSSIIRSTALSWPTILRTRMIEARRSSSGCRWVCFLVTARGYMRSGDS